jgi:hypothetical protein
MTAFAVKVRSELRFFYVALNNRLKAKPVFSGITSASLALCLIDHRQIIFEQKLSATGAGHPAGQVRAGLNSKS